MQQVIICGRGGQGVMATAEVLATALWNQGKFVQAFPSFQPEKKGAPTAAFIRYDNEDIWLRCEIDSADIVVVLDSAAISSLDIMNRLLSGGLLICNGAPSSLPSHAVVNCRLAEVNASQIAIRHKLGTRLTPQVNMLMLGAFARLSEDMSLAALESAIAAKTTDMTDSLRLAIHEAYEQVSEVLS
jgi:pyruvate ferredoxin oxidoreductase gamma subunit